MRKYHDYLALRLSLSVASRLWFRENGYPAGSSLWRAWRHCTQRKNKVERLQYQIGSSSSNTSHFRLQMSRERKPHFSPIGFPGIQKQPTSKSNNLKSKNFLPEQENFLVATRRVVLPVPNAVVCLVVARVSC